MKKQTTFGLIVGTRGFFNVRLAQEGRRHLLQKMEKLGLNYVILPEDTTPTGAIETFADAQKCARLFHERREEIDGLVVVLPNFGDELGVVNALHLARLDVPVLVQASDDDIDKVDTANRRDSFCGKISVCNNLYQYGIPFTDTTYHTCPIDSDLFEHDLAYFASVCHVVNGLRRARIGAIGARPAAFQTMRASEKLLQASGITVIPVDLSEIIFRANRLDGQAAKVKAKLAEIKEYGSIPSTVKNLDDKLLRQARLCATLDEWIAENSIDAAGVQCWTSIQDNYGCAACLAMSMLSNKLIPCACEVDLVGVLAMYALALATGEPAALADWNNNYQDDRDMCVAQHCSNYPRSFIGSRPEITTLEVLGANLGMEICFGAIMGKVAAGPMTYFRISTDDVRGKIKAYLGEGEFTADPFPMSGGIAVCRIPNLQRLLKYICKNGFEHHAAMVRTHCAGVIEEALSTYMKWELYRHG